MLRAVRVNNLQWGAGLYCSFLGIMMLISPHRFDYLVGTDLYEYIGYWGTLFLLTGISLFSIPIMLPPRWMVTASHLAASLLIFSYGISIVLLWTPNEVWIAPLTLTVLALGLLAALLIPGAYDPTAIPLQARGLPIHNDWLTILLGVSAMTIGVVFFAQAAFPGSLPLTILFTPTGYWLRGVAYLIIGAGLVLSQSQRVRRLAWIRPRMQFLWRFVHLVGAALFLFSLLLPSQTGTLNAYFLEFGIFLLILPWLPAQTRARFSNSLEARLALLLNLVFALPLIFSVSLISNQEERSVMETAGQNMRSQATVVSERINEYASGYWTVLQMIDSQHDLRALNPAQLHEVLDSSRAVYPQAIAFSVFDQGGNPLASTSENAMKRSASGFPFFERPKADGLPALDVLISPIFQRPVLAFSRPLAGPQGEFRGIVALSLPSDHIFKQLSEVSPTEDTTAYLVDQAGKVIAHPSITLAESFADLSGTPPVRALLNESSPGLVRYNLAQEEMVASYDRVPYLGWGVILERPVESILAGVYRGRDTAMLFLILFIPLAVLIGTRLAVRIAAPLHDLSKAAAEMADENGSTPLPVTGFEEFNRLSGVFDAMRKRLLLRTQEREEALAALREANETLEKRVQERTLEIEQERARLKAIFDAAPEGITVVDHEGKIVFTNPVAEQIYARPVPLGQPVESHASLRLLHASGEEFEVDELPLTRSVRRGETIKNFEMAIVWPEGQKRDLLVNSAPIRNSQGETKGAVGVFQDISKLKRLEHDLFTQRELLQMIVEMDPAGIAVVAASTDGIRIEMCNPAYQEFTPHPEYPANGSLFAKVWPEDEGFIADDFVRPVIENGESLVMPRFDRTYPNGAARSFAIHIKPLEWDRRPAALMVTWETTQLEEATQKAKWAAQQAEERALELERSNRDLQDFAFIASHDLLEPLRKVQAFGERLKSRYATELGGEGQDWINRMQNASSRMQGMLDDLLSYSRISTRAQPFRMIDMNAIIAQAVSDLEIRIERANGILHIDPLPHIQADPTQMRQLFQNLIGNALKFTRPNDRPEITVWAEQLAPDRVTIYVKDEGIGLDMAYASQIFEPFRRLHGRSEYEGNGMGLAICRKIVERHEGSISVTSQPGHGALFSVCLPVEQKANEPETLAHTN